MRVRARPKPAAAPPTSTPWVQVFGPGGAIGPAGPPGPTGAQGAQGPIGPSGPTPAQAGARVYRSTQQPIPNNAFQAIGFDTVRWDILGNTWAAANPTRLTCQVAGVYTITGHVVYLPSGAGANRIALVVLNGSIYLGQQGPAPGDFNASSYPRITVSATHRLNVGDYVELWCYQDSGAALNTLQSDNVSQFAAADFEMAIAGGPQGPTGVGVPTPVVNGQWIKGVGGAAVWSPITPADVGIPTVPRTWTRSNFASGPPASPAVGDRWLATNPLGSSSAEWEFEYDGSNWKFAGGGPLRWYLGGSTVTATGWQAIPYITNPFVFPRPGNYTIDVSFAIYSSTTNAGWSSGWAELIVGWGPSIGSIWSYIIAEHYTIPPGTGYWKTITGQITAAPNTANYSGIFQFYDSNIGWQFNQVTLSITPTYVS
jgi:hypothetical protein